MSLDTVIKDIREEARARADEITQHAETRAEEIINEAETDAKRIREERQAKVDSEIAQEREQALSSAKLQAKQERLGARRDVLQEVRERVESELAGMEGDRRVELTRTLLEASLKEFDTDTIEMYGNADDEELLTELVGEYDRAEYGGTTDILGGVVAESEAANVRVNNSFDSVLDDVWDDGIKELSDQLFEQ
ncbi:MAG: archaeal/vacuolar-type H+-ATPase subunit E [uncultured archaeon A07HR60]|jgi:Archaeal/vacuolar-type H+-ATPase subunit E|nr:MAG: archaeal/vacuolar-type H+-ATPase subunit E [uncultured archaeon A07HR60]